MSAKHVLLTRNTKGRDFVVGDIHGEYTKLMDALLKVRFNDNDRLISVGDLVDRGMESFKVLELFNNRDNFYAVRGNHEQMLIDGATGTERQMSHHLTNGGVWFYELDDHTQGRALHYAGELPYAITIETGYGRVGVVHAQPYGVDWDEMITALSLQNQHVQDMVLWSRGIISSGKSEPIQGVKHVYCGHTVVDKPKSVANIRFIDTGAVFGRPLTIVQISP